MSIEIEKNVPVPLDRRTSEFTNALKGMEIGDSFLLPADRKVDSARAALHSASRRYGKKFIVRKAVDGHRVWRLE